MHRLPKTSALRTGMAIDLYGPLAQGNRQMPI